MQAKRTLKPARPLIVDPTLPTQLQVTSVRRAVACVCSPGASVDLSRATSRGDKTGAGAGSGLRRRAKHPSPYLTLLMSAPSTTHTHMLDHKRLASGPVYYGRLMKFVDRAASLGLQHVQDLPNYLQLDGAKTVERQGCTHNASPVLSQPSWGGENPEPLVVMRGEGQPKPPSPAPDGGPRKKSKSQKRK